MEYKVSELAEKAGVTKRTIHYYISKGLLMPPYGEGINSTYDDKHLERLKMIKELQKDDMPLNKIRDAILNNPKNIKKHKRKSANYLARTKVDIARSKTIYIRCLFHC